MLSYQIDRTERIVSILGPEASSIDELEVLFHRILHDQQFRVGYGFLRDRRHLPAPRSDIVHGVMAMLTRLPDLPRSRFALVVPTNDPASYGMMRMAQILASGAAIEVEIFNDVEKARTWLTTAPPMSKITPPFVSL